MDFSVFRKESLFDVEDSDFQLVEKYIQALMTCPHELKSSRAESLDKLYFFQDVWFFIQYGKHYKEAVVNHSVALKDVRLSFLEFLSTLDDLELVQVLTIPQRFIFCYCFLTKLFSYSRKRVLDEKALQGLRGDYYNALSKSELTEVLQQKVIASYYSEWFKQGYLLSKIYQKKLTEVNKITFAIQDVCGLVINESNVDLTQFIHAVLQADELLEISFWKKKFKEQGISALFKQNNEQAFQTLAVCVQQNEQMRPLLKMQIGLIFAMLAISEEKGCDFVYIPYAEQINKELYCEKGCVAIEQYMELVQQFIGGDGPSNYRQLLNTAFTMLKLNPTSSGGEIIIMCDNKIEECVPQDALWKKAVLDYKEQMNIHITVIYSGSFNRDISIWFADRIMFIEDFQTKMTVGLSNKPN